MSVLAPNPDANRKEKRVPLLSKPGLDLGRGNESKDIPPPSLHSIGVGALAGTWPHLAAAPAPPLAGAPTARSSRRALRQLPAQPRRPPPSPTRGPSPAALVVAAACGRVGEGRPPPTPPHPTGRENKAAAAAALTFSVSVPRSPRRLLTELGSTGREKLQACQRLGPGPRASEASRASQNPARHRRPFFPPSLPPPRPVLRPEGGGPGRARRGRARGGGARPARGLPGAVVSPPARSRGGRVGLWLDPAREQQELRVLSGSLCTLRDPEGRDRVHIPVTHCT
ncbi:translation initiation factor IF-2-like [Bubalus bubalis]|uniref:translation initiation factor IF-2-like n=1 Tax=Bubalus bubalis TaxID=89462 RepID=UPI001D10FD52|nr:translation initiation factor IF-2-like [Bubalus bubalis]